MSSKKFQIYDHHNTSPESPRGVPCLGTQSFRTLECALRTFRNCLILDCKDLRTLVYQEAGSSSSNDILIASNIEYHRAILEYYILLIIYVIKLCINIQECSRV